MGNEKSRLMIQQCLGTEVLPIVVKSLAGATEDYFEVNYDDTPPYPIQQYQLQHKNPWSGYSR